MEKENKWKNVIEEIERLLRLRTFPVGVRFLEDEKELEKIPPKKLVRPPKNTFACQLTTLARTYGHTYNITEKSLMPVCSNILGFCDILPRVADGEFRSIAWCETKEDARKYEASVPRLPLRKYSNILMGPQVRGLFDPDIVLFYGNPAQIILAVNALQFTDYERIVSYCIGESSSCAETLVQSFLMKKPHVSLPCFGERRYGHAQDDEIIVVVPGTQVEKLRRNLIELFKRGVRYPIAYVGAGENVSARVPKIYHEIQGITDDYNYE
jgi:uncharacterized protein (DUF169 family)